MSDTHLTNTFINAAAEQTFKKLDKHEKLMSFEYAVTLPPIPNPSLKRKIDPSRLRELRKQLENEPSHDFINTVFTETMDSWVDLCSGNIIIQKLVEHGSDSQKTALICAVAPHMAAIGIRKLTCQIFINRSLDKNGTWAVQKMIECARTDEQITHICNALKPYIPALLLDQFGNYVVQCCLKFDAPHNQFIFDSIYAKCADIAQGRFGARAIRTCLDSQYTTQEQRDLVSESLMRNSHTLSTNANGSLLLNWVLDSQYSDHYMGIVANLNSHLAQLCCHKLASPIILRLINQQLCLSSRDFLLRRIFFQTAPPPLVKDIMFDQNQGHQFVQKVITSPYIDEKTKISIQTVVDKWTENAKENQFNGYRRVLYDDSQPFLVGPNQPMYSRSRSGSVSIPFQQHSRPRSSSVSMQPMTQYNFLKTKLSSGKLDQFSPFSPFSKKNTLKEEFAPPASNQNNFDMNWNLATPSHPSQLNSTSSPFPPGIIPGSNYLNNSPFSKTNVVQQNNPSPNAGSTMNPAANPFVARKTRNRASSSGHITLNN